MRASSSGGRTCSMGAIIARVYQSSVMEMQAVFNSDDETETT